MAGCEGSNCDGSDSVTIHVGSKGHFSRSVMSFAGSQCDTFDDADPSEGFRQVTSQEVRPEFQDHVESTAQVHQWI